MDLERIISELKSEHDRIGSAIDALLEGGSLSATNGSPRRRRQPKRVKGISPAGRKRLSEAMKARWALRNGKSASIAKPVASAGRKRRGMSAAGRKRIADAMRKRWAEKRKAASKTGR